MFRFKNPMSFRYLLCLLVSIHPMFRFKKIPAIVIGIPLRFNTSYVSVQDNLNLAYQDYNFCFNTSYVSVQVNPVAICYFYIKVSIHPMFRFKLKKEDLKFMQKYCFNTSYVSVQAASSNCSIFKLQLVSIHPMFRFKINFNLIFIYSSYVSIHPMFRFKITKYLYYCSSGFVSIHPMFRFKLKLLYSLFQIFYMFQYILCFGSSQQKNFCKME